MKEDVVTDPFRSKASNLSSCIEWLSQCTVFKKIRASRFFLTCKETLNWCWRALRFLITISYKAISATIIHVIRHPFLTIFHSLLIVTLATMAVTGSEINEQIILSEISDNTIREIMNSSQFNRSFSNEELKRDGTRELTNVGAPAWVQREGIKAILFHARKASLPIEDQAVLLAIANIESGFNAFARANTTTACGLFQFIQATGEAFSLSSAECMDPWKNAEAGINHYLANYNKRVGQQVHDLSGAELVFRTFELSYYLHHDGPASTSQSTEVKAIILDGTQFLFSAYRALKKESEIEQNAPSFFHIFTNRIWEIITGLTDSLPTRSFPLLAWFSDESNSKNDPITETIKA